MTLLPCRSYGGMPFRIMPLGLLLLLGCGTDADRSGDSSVLMRRRAAVRIKDCGVADTTVMTGHGIAELRLTRMVDEVVRRCTVVRDTVELREEALPARILSVDLGRDTVEAQPAGGKLWRIAVDGPAFRTADSLGVGTPLSRLLEIPGVRAATGESADIYVFSPQHCGLSFRTSARSDGSIRRWTVDALRRLPPETRVEEVLITGIGCE